VKQFAPRRRVRGPSPLAMEDRIFTIAIDFSANSAPAPAAPRADGLERYEPSPRYGAVYDKFYAVYRQLLDSFVELNKSIDLSRFMKTLIEIKYAPQQ